MARKSQANTSPKKSYPMQVVEGTVHWCKVFEPNQDGKFSLDITPTNQEGYDAFTKFGIEAKSKEDSRGQFFSLWQYGTGMEGEPRKMEVYDAAMNPWDPSKLIGNGSLIKIEFKPKEWEYKGKTGMRGELLRLQVLKHVAYGGSLLKAEPEYTGGSSDETPKFAAQG